MNSLGSEGKALVALGEALRSTGYRFTTPTPETHRIVLERDKRPARDLRDVFGWSRPFRPSLLPAELFRLAEQARVVTEGSDGLRASVRFSTLGSQLFVHSAYPTLAADSVFFGPDTYRFCAALARHMDRRERIVDLGCGSGAGGLSVAGLAGRVVLSDISERALRFAAVNAELSGVAAELVQGDGLSAVTGAVDGVICNPPYLRDRDARIYREGGGHFGEGLALRWLEEAAERLRDGGVLILYTGAPIVDGVDWFFRAAEPICKSAGADVRYEELDPDVFGEELADPIYRGVERIAAVALVARFRDERR
jgi:SAM-dependent methyltransferase